MTLSAAREYVAGRMPVLCHGHSRHCRPPAGEGNFESAVRSLIEWMGDGEAGARCYLADRAEPVGASLAAAHGHDVTGYAAIVREPDYAGFRSRSIPLVHQIAVAGPFRRRGVAALGIAVGLFDEYGPSSAAVWTARLSS